MAMVRFDIAAKPYPNLSSALAYHQGFYYATPSTDNLRCDILGTRTWSQELSLFHITSLLLEEWLVILVSQYTPSDHSHALGNGTTAHTPRYILIKLKILNCQCAYNRFTLPLYLLRRPLPLSHIFQSKLRRSLK